jgi:hypothetical protein
MSSYNYLKASDGTGNAVLAHVTLARLAAATVLKVDSVSKWPAGGFIATVGTLDGTGFLTPASITEFTGHITGSDIIIDGFEAGFTDLGNSSGQIVIIKQTTGWANSVVTQAQVGHNDDGTHKKTALDAFYKPSELTQWNFIASGCVWTGNALGATLLASMSAGVVYINGVRLTVAAVVSRAFTANNDTYVDFKDNGDGTASVTYSTVANNVASPALAGAGTFFNTLRNAIIVAGATAIANINKVNNGQLRADAPVVASNTLTVNDSLGNLIGNRSPQPRLLGYRNGANTSVGAGGTATITGTTCPIVLPSTFRRIKGTLTARDHGNNTAGQYSGVGIANSTDAVNISPGSFTNSGTTIVPASPSGYDSPLTTNPTYIGQISSPGTGTATAEAGIALMIELD